MIKLRRKLVVFQYTNLVHTGTAFYVIKIIENRTKQEKTNKKQQQQTKTNKKHNSKETQTHGQTKTRKKKSKQTFSFTLRAKQSEE